MREVREGEAAAKQVLFKELNARPPVKQGWGLLSSYCAKEQLCVVN